MASNMVQLLAKRRCAYSVVAQLIVECREWDLKKDHFTTAILI